MSKVPHHPALQAYEPVRPLETISYSLGDCGFNLYWAPLTAFLMIYLTDVVGIKVAAVGGLLVIMRLLGAVADPLFAAFADRTRTQYGHYRPYFLWLCVPLAASGILAFSMAGIPEVGKLPAVYISLNILYLVYTAIMVPYNALSGVMTPDGAQRETIMSMRFGLAFLTSVLITWVTPKLVSFTGVGQEALGWQFAMTVYGVIAVLIFVNLFLNVKERIDTAQMPGVNAFQDVMDLFRSGPWLALAAAGFMIMMATALHTGVSSYYIKYLAGRPDLMTAFAMCFGLGLAAGSAAASWLALKASRRAVIAGSLALTGAAGIGLYCVPSSEIGVIFALQVLTGMALGPVSTLTFAMAADIADLNAWKTGRRATAMTFSGIMSVKKVGAALAAALIGYALATKGYAANEAASPALLDNIRLLMGLLPAVMAAVGAGLIWLCDLDGARVRRVKAEPIVVAD